jgi:hypothetical protein
LPASFGNYVMRASGRAGEIRVVKMPSATTHEIQSKPLHVLADGAIVDADLDPVHGWITDREGGPAQALVFPRSLLERHETEFITYACILPAPEQDPKDGAVIEKKPSPGKPGSKLLASSLPGGQVPVFRATRGAGAIGFRWAYHPASAEGTLAWRCFYQWRNDVSAGAWTAFSGDYVFECASGRLLDGPANIETAMKGLRLAIRHPDGMLTCLPSQAGLVKVTTLCADGWPKRELRALNLYPGGGIVAQFSEGAAKKIATAAP